MNPPGWATFGRGLRQAAAEAAAASAASPVPQAPRAVQALQMPVPSMPPLSVMATMARLAPHPRPAVIGLPFHLSSPILPGLPVLSPHLLSQWASPYRLAGLLV